METFLKVIYEQYYIFLQKKEKYKVYLIDFHNHLKSIS